jgi:hypothetical protein
LPNGARNPRRAMGRDGIRHGAIRPPSGSREC